MSFEEDTGSPRSAPREWVTTRAVQAHLGNVSKNTVTAYIRAGMPAHQLIPGGRYLFDLAEIDEWIDSRWRQRAAGRSA